MAFTLATDIFTSIDTGMAAVMTHGLGAFSTLIAPLIGASVSLYATFIALRWITGAANEQPIMEIVTKVVYMALFTLFAFNVAQYNTFIVAPANSIGSEIASAFSSSGKSSENVIDQMAQQIITTMDLIWENTDVITLTGINVSGLFRMIIAIIVVLVGGSVFIAISFAYLAIAKIMVALVLCVGPLFISASFFPVTRNFFFLWVNQLVNYILLSALFGITFTLLTNLLQTYVSSPDFTDPVLGDLVILKLLFCYLVFSGVIMAIPQLSSSLSGGVGINGLGGIGAIMSGAKGLLSKLLPNKPSSSSSNTITGGNNRKLG